MKFFSTFSCVKFCEQTILQRSYNKTVELSELLGHSPICDRCCENEIGRGLCGQFILIIVNFKFI